MTRLSIEPLERRALFTGGQLDPTFGTGGITTTDFGGTSDASFKKIAVAPDGTTYAAGSLGSKLILARYTAAGQLDTAFNKTGTVTIDLGLGSTARVLAVQSDGDVLVGGTTAYSTYTTVGVSQIVIARYTPAGQLDASWGTNGIVQQSWVSGANAHLAWVGVNASGVYAVGDANNALIAAKYSSNGTLDTSYGTNGLATLGATGVSRLAATDADFSGSGGIVIGGSGLVPSTASPNALVTQDEVASLTAAGVADSGFAGGGIEALPAGSFSGSLLINDLLVDGKGRILIAGGVGNYGAVGRLTAAGALDPTYGNGGYLYGAQAPGYRIAPIGAIGILGNGQVVATEPGDPTTILRLTIDGQPDTSGTVPATLSVPNEYFGLAVAPDDSVLLAGEHFLYVAAPPYDPAAIARLTPPMAPGNQVIGSVFEDLNGNGTKDANESAYTGYGITAFLDANGDGIPDNGEQTVYTGGSGQILFNNVAPGTYTLRLYNLASANVRQTLPAVSGGIAFTINAGDTVYTGPAFGVQQTFGIYGYAFNDTNGDGIYANETGAAGRTIYADENDDGVLDAGDISTVTDSYGSYKLTLPIGTNTLREVLPGGYQETGRYAPSAAAGSTFVSSGVVTAIDKNSSPLDFGSRPTPPPPPAGASAAGVVFDDANKDGKQDNGEGGIAGATVYVDIDNDKVLDANEASTTTDANGNYSFANLPNTGTVTRLRTILPSGSTQTTPANGNGYALTLTPGATNAGKTFGLYTPPATPPSTGSISGFAFDDANKDGLYESTETKTSGKVVFLDTNDNGKLDAGEKSVTTGSGGAWSFGGLAAGTYHVRRVFPSGYTQSNAPIDVTLTAGQAVGGLSIGSKAGSVTPPPATGSTITGFAFNDANKNGQYDAGDTLAAGKTIWLDLDDDGIKDANEPSVVTDSSGKFSFANLATGYYYVRRVFPSGYVQSTPSAYVYVTPTQTVSVSIGSKTV